MIRFPARRRLFALTLLLLPATACLDGPFAHVNPNDPNTEIVLSIAGGADTLRVAGQSVLFQLVTTPVTGGFTSEWSSSNPTLLNPTGLGRYVVGGLPVVPTTVQVTAQFGTHSGSRSVVVLPAP